MKTPVTPITVTNATVQNLIDAGTNGLWFTHKYGKKNLITLKHDTSVFGKPCFTMYMFQEIDGEREDVYAGELMNEVSVLQMLSDFTID